MLQEAINYQSPISESVQDEGILAAERILVPQYFSTSETTCQSQKLIKVFFTMLPIVKNVHYEYMSFSLTHNNYVVQCDLSLYMYVYICVYVWHMIHIHAWYTYQIRMISIYITLMILVVSTSKILSCSFVLKFILHYFLTTITL
jgi:hypothetical protein